MSKSAVATKPATKVVTKVVDFIDYSDEHTKIESLRPLHAEIERFLVWYGDQLHQVSLTHSDVPAIDEYAELISARNRVVPKIDKDKTGGTSCFGTFGAERWAFEDGQKASEIVITGEHLGRPMMDIFVTCAHERQHMWFHQVGIKDCSKSNNHNETGHKLGLAMGHIYAERDKNRGWSSFKFSPEFEAKVLNEFKPNEKLFNMHRIATPAKPKREPSYLKFECACPMIARAKADFAAVCSHCSEPYVLAN